MFDIAIEGELRNLHPLVRDEIYKIGCEALRNAFRHAQARRVCAEIVTTLSNYGCACGTRARA
jgi:signal transduction histidine kinase